MRSLPAGALDACFGADLAAKAVVLLSVSPCAATNSGCIAIAMSVQVVTLCMITLTFHTPRRGNSRAATSLTYDLAYSREMDA